MLLWPAPNLRDNDTKAFVSIMKRSSATKRIHTLVLSPDLEVALQGYEVAVDAPLQQQFEYLMRCIEAILGAGAGKVQIA